MRITEREYFFGIAELSARRSTCERRQVGAVAVARGRVVATGYNGAPVGLPHCSSYGCVRQEERIASGTRHELCRGVHAEQNVILQAAILGVRLSGSDLYVTTSPCSICARMIINAGFITVYYTDTYSDEVGLSLLRAAGVRAVAV